MRSNVGPVLLLMLLLALFGGFAWLTQHPDAEIVRRAESWPFVGPLASLFRQRYIPPPPVPSEPAAAVAVEVVEPAVKPVGEGTVWVIPDTVMRQQPSQTSPKILQFDAIANVVKLESRGDWYRVWYRRQEGWVYLEGYGEDEPPYGRDPEPPKALPSRPPDAESLAIARSFLGDGGRVVSAGPFTVYTDSTDDGLLAVLDKVAAELEAAYAERYGRTLTDVAREAVVLFADRAAYNRLQAESPRLVGLTSSGHTSSGLAVLYAGGRTADDVASTLVHELTHTLNRRALGPALPSWLDEGLADDLAASAIAADGRLVLGSLGGERLQEGERITLTGGLAAVRMLRDRVRAARLISVQELLHLDWQVFVRGDRSELHYATSAFWVRFLLEAEDGRYASAFRAYLRSISEGGPATAEALREQLGESWSVLNARFQLWIDAYGGPEPVRLGVEN